MNVVMLWSGQSIVVFVVALAYWKAVSYMDPYTYDTDDSLADIAQGFVVVMFFLAMLMQAGELRSSTVNVFAGGLVCMVLYMLLSMVLESKEEIHYILNERKVIQKEIQNIFSGDDLGDMEDTEKAFDRLIEHKKMKKESSESVANEDDEDFSRNDEGDVESTCFDVTSYDESNATE